MVHPHTVPLPRGALLSACTMCGTGTERRRFWYPAFDVYKYSLSSHHAGDILFGATKDLFPGGRRWLPHERLGGAAQPARINHGPRPACWEACGTRTVAMPHARPLVLPLCA